MLNSDNELIGSPVLSCCWLGSDRRWRCPAVRLPLGCIGSGGLHSLYSVLVASVSICTGLDIMLIAVSYINWVYLDVLGNKHMNRCILCKLGVSRCTG